MFALIAIGLAATAAQADYVTVYDGSGYLGVGPAGEDQETEPHCVNSQAWDLEAVLYDNDTNQLTLIGGWDFLQEIHGIGSGDLFLAINNIPTASAGNGSYGYDYVFDIDWAGVQDIDATTASVGYQQYDISGGASLSLPTAWPNDLSAPVSYISGGTKVGNTHYASFQSYADDASVNAAFTDLFIAPLMGGKHYSLTFDWDAPNGSSIYTHFTQECGNDNLVGQFETPVVPEPASIGLLSLGLIGMVARKRRLI